MKLLFTLSLIVFVFIPLAGFAANLEISYPQPTDPSGNLVAPGGGPASWIRWIFVLSLSLLGVVTVGSLVYAGILWMTSNSEAKVAEARDRVKSALIGVVIVLGSVVLLGTINPALVTLKNPTIQPGLFRNPGISIGAAGELGGLCATTPPACTAPGTSCDTSGFCLLNGGQECSRSNDLCRSTHYCWHKFGLGKDNCQPRLPAGSQCDQNKYQGRDCQSGQCINNECK